MSAPRRLRTRLAAMLLFGGVRRAALPCGFRAGLQLRPFDIVPARRWRLGVMRALADRERVVVSRSGGRGCRLARPVGCRIDPHDDYLVLWCRVGFATAVAAPEQPPQQALQVLLPVRLAKLAADR